MWVTCTIKLLTDPRQHDTKSGKSMSTCFAGTDVGGSDFFVFNIVCFNELATELARYRKGDSLAVSGPLKATSWEAKDGTPKSGFQVVLDGLSGVKRRGPVQVERNPRKQADSSRQIAFGMPFSDSLDF